MNSHGLSPHTLALLGAIKAAHEAEALDIYCDPSWGLETAIQAWVDAGCPDLPTEPDMPEVTLNGHHFAAHKAWCSKPKCEARRDDPSGECPVQR